jgi:IclR family mhp operon transcriptional activator
MDIETDDLVHDESRESTRPIRALLRGLDVLTILNVRNGATVSDVAGEIRLPRTTTYRILETLCSAGYVFRDVADDRYRLTIMVRGLSDGFDDEAWVSQIARPFIHELCREVVWPVTVSTLSGTSMMVRETTDHRTPLAVERYSAGFRVPLLASAAGRVYLAFCPAVQREALLEILAGSDQEDDRPARNRQEINRLLDEVRSLGHATATRARRVSDEVSMAVPIQVDERVLAAITIRFAATAVSLKQANERFLPRLRDVAARIRQQFVGQGGTPRESARSEHRLNPRALEL